MQDIYDILECAGYDTTNISDDEWDELQSDWEDECEQYLDDAVEHNKKEIVFEWVNKLGLKKLLDSRKKNKG